MELKGRLKQKILIIKPYSTNYCYVYNRFPQRDRDFSEDANDLNVRAIKNHSPNIICVFAK